MSAGVLGQVADIIDPDTHVEHPELRTPVTLAARCDPKYQRRGHLDVIGEEFAKLDAGDFDRLLINTPPQVGKSTTAVEWAAFWWLCRHPTHRVIVGSYNDKLAGDRGRNIRRLVQRYGAAYGLMIERGSASQLDWRLTTGGGVLSAGIASGIAGRPGHIVFVDDPTKSRAEAESAAHRDRVVNWYSGDVTSRLAPGAPVVLIQTPWHPDELRAQIVKQEGRRETGGRWRVCIMAAINEDPDDPMGRGIGEPLPHPQIADGDVRKLTRYWELKRAGSTVRDWRALYQCDPKAPEGQLVKSELLRQRRCFEHGTCAPATRTGVAIDPSGGGRDTAGVIGGYLGDDKRAYILADRSAVMSSAQWSRAACEMAVEIGADFFVYESNYGGDMVALALRTAWEQLRAERPDDFGPLVPRIISVIGRKNKILRAEPIAQQWIEDKVRTAAYLPDLESEWSTYVPGQPSPGRIDASVYLALEVLPLPASGETTAVGAMQLAETNLLARLGR